MADERFARGANRSFESVQVSTTDKLVIILRGRPRVELHRGISVNAQRRRDLHAVEGNLPRLRRPVFLKIVQKAAGLNGANRRLTGR